MIQATKNIEKILKQIYDHDYYSVVRDFFEMSAISVRNAVDYTAKREEYEQRYLQIAKSYTKEQLVIFSQALGVFFNEILSAIDGKSGFYDWAGELYMNSETYNKNMGQFFTPYHVSQVLAKISINGEAIKRQIAADPDTIISINEPTCGAGGIIVAAIEALHQSGINYAYNAFVDCCDIDSRCVHMTYLTLSLLGVPAIVRLGDSLMLKYREFWYTPAYIFAFSRFNRRLRQGCYQHTTTTPKIENKPHFESKKTIVPIADKSGQYVINFI